jgi:ribonuclease E
MANKMLIDAAHPEETRVVVVRGHRVEEFDFEAANRKQLRGNIYLAKVTRVEPSLQAAFVDYGGNRHGFLAFSEIHPDYYQIPVADRQALIAAEEREAREAEDRATAADRRREAAVGGPVDDDDVEAEVEGEAEAESEEHEGDRDASAENHGGSENSREEVPAEPVLVEATDPMPPAAADSLSEAPSPHPSDEEAQSVAPESAEAQHARGTNGDSLEVDSDESVESVGAVDALEELPERRKSRMRQYKIQEVIKRRQVLLVQVVKEERGNKGAALTTYLSLAGRYSVLMPNTARGGGISRKITSITDRKRLKNIVSDLSVPQGMGVILRTAGASRTRAEVKRDFEYLLRLWETVRDLTLKSTAPALVYEEGSLIKRSIRDLYNKDIDEVMIAGDDAYREAKEFMRMLMPSHAKNVKQYKDSQPIFARYGIEAQLDAMFSPQVGLPSGGYSVINQTEALVAIDVNSGRSTREHSIEDTALQTNLEAAEEVARQLRLRDLAGLIVIDFIDMEEKRNNRSVERRLKDALKNDRARIQVGRISHFGLLEMSRQRIRTGVVESTTTVCPTCQGTGHVRSPASVALHVLRSLEEQLPKGATHNLTIRTRANVALYILNQKRAHLSEIERRFGISVTVLADDLIPAGQHFTIERGEAVEPREVSVITTVQPDSIAPQDLAADNATDAAEQESTEAEPEAAEDNDEGERSERAERPQQPGNEQRREREGGRRRRRRRGRGSGNGDVRPGGDVRRDSPAPAPMATFADEDEASAPMGGDEAERPAFAGEGVGGDDDQPRKRRRGRRGGRRGRRDRGERGGSERPASNGAAPQPGEDHRHDDMNGEANGVPMAAEPTYREEPELRPTVAPADSDFSARREEDEPIHQRSPIETPEPEQKPQPETAEDDETRPKRSGWWTRRSFF